MNSADRLPWLGQRLPKDQFYGWWVTLACGMVLFVAIGIGFYVLPIFLKPLQVEHGWTEVQVSAAATLYFSVSGLTAAFLGPAVDRVDPRKFIGIGLIGMGTCLALVGQIQQLWQLFAVYTLMAISFALAAHVPINTVLTRWWVAKRAKAMSIAFSFVSIGGFIFAPTGTWLIERGGLSLAGPVLGAAVVIIALPFVILVIVSQPSDVGMFPDGNEAPLAEVHPVSHSKTQARTETRAEIRADARTRTMGDQTRVWSRSEAMRTSAIWRLTIGFLLVFTCQVGYLVHQVAFLETRYSVRTAAFAVSITALGSAVARLVVGTFADRIEKRHLTVVLVLTQALAVLLLQISGAFWLDMLLVLVFGFTMGNIFMMHSLLTSEIFGMTSFGTVFGFSSAIAQTGSGAGPLLIGLIRSQTQSYSTAFVASGLLTVAAAFILSTVRAPQQDGWIGPQLLDRE